ncbi:MarR family winged helix-turn-helix transcriptional regulator [Streptomyces sp. NPDC101490]|uniref:MarR family winged helix-turn-helix transcriptional regulator n=1 Tax=Streptomyces sp. NPDC101490 TaxID=3366143 RepID=UPI003829D699
MNDTPRWLSPEEQDAWRGFVSLHEKLAARLSRHVQAQSGLSAADYMVLVNLTDVPDGRLRFLELAKAAEWEKSRMSHHIARMEKRGLVAREECAEDGRVAVIAITQAGREAIAAAAPKHVEAVRRMFIDPLTPQELRTYARLTKRILERMEEEPF